MDEGDPHRVLARNAACHQCRRRKLKCDAIRPTCGNCRKPRQRGPIKYEPPEPCTWDEVRGPSARTLRKREAKERRALQSGGDGTGGPSVDWSNGQQQQQHHGMMMGENESYMPMNYSANGAPIYDMNHHGPSSGIVPGADWGGPMPPGLRIAESVKTEGFSVNDLPDDPATWNTSHELVYSNWPRDLPAPPVVDHIVHVFFERVPLVPRAFHKPTFFAKLKLPPQHIDFPLVVIHGILGVTAPYLSTEALASRAYFPTGASLSDQLHPERDFTPLADSHQPSGMLSLNARLGGTGTPLSRFQLWHRRKCVEGLSSQISFGQGLLQAMYATSLVSFMDYMNGWFVDIWMEAMSGVRLGTGLNLHNSSIHQSDSLDRNIAYLLPPVKTALEQAERDRVWWMAYMMEKLTCSGMSWPLGIADDEITVELPVTQEIYDQRTGDAIGVQNLQSPDLYSVHPPQHQGALPLLVKAMKLFTDTNTFQRRYSRGPHTYVRYLTDPTLRQLLADINAFRTNLPPHLRRSIRTNETGAQTVDTELFLVIGFTHAAVINLGEPLITHQTWANDAAKMVLTAIRANLSFIYELNATTYDITLLPSQASFLWILSARCLGRFVNAARLAGDNVAAGVFASEYSVFETALAQLSVRHPVSKRHLKRVEFFRTAWVQPGEVSVKVAYDKDQVWDEEFENKQKTQASSSGSQHASPATNVTELNTPGRTPGQSGAGVPVSPSHTVPAPVFKNASPLSAQPPQPASNPISPTGIPLGGTGGGPSHPGLAPPMGVAPQHVTSGYPLQNQVGGMPQQHLAAPPYGQPPPQPPPQGVQLSTAPVQQPPPPPVQQRAPPPTHVPSAAMQAAMPHLMASGGENVGIPPWFQGMDGFNISSYSFDMDSMLAMLQNENPNATFDGTTAFSMSTA